MRAAFWLLVFAFGLLLLWAFTPSRLFLNPTAVAIRGYEVTVTRTFPMERFFGRPFAAYVETVRNLETGEVCQDDNAKGFRYSANAGDVGQWNIESWAARCMAGGYHWRATWWVKILGRLPLIPTELETIVRE